MPSDNTAQTNTKETPPNAVKEAPAAKGGKEGRATKAKKKVKRQISDGIVHILSSFNNTIVTITDVQGNTLVWESCAKCGYRGSRKSTPYAAGEAAQKAGLHVVENFGMKSVEVYVKRPRSRPRICYSCIKSCWANY